MTRSSFLARKDGEVRKKGAGTFRDPYLNRTCLAILGISPLGKDTVSYCHFNHG